MRWRCRSCGSAMARRWERWQSSWSKPGGWVEMGEGCLGSHGEGKQDAGLEDVPLAGSRPAHFSPHVFMSLIHLAFSKC